jgi:hypothetical protein
MTIRSESQDVDDYMALTSQGALAAVIAADSPLFGRSHRLAIDNFNARLPIATVGFPQIPLESVVYSLPRPQQPPASKVFVDRLMRRKFFQQQAPLATATQDIEDSIHHLHVGGSRPATSFCCRNALQNSDLSPRLGDSRQPESKPTGQLALDSKSQSQDCYGRPF